MRLKTQSNQNSLRYGSVFSGIEAASVAWHSLGWKPAWFSEIDKFTSAVLSHHYPKVINLGDMTLIRQKISTGEVVAPDVLVGGSPCQAFSISGLRKSLSDSRGELTLEYVRLANEIDENRKSKGQPPAIIVWENVPGVLTTQDNAFGNFLAALAGEGTALQPPGGRWKNAGCVFGSQRKIAWRILDAQFFGLAQRRKRVFVIASAREGFNPCQVLFESKIMSGNLETSPSEKQKVTPSSGASAGTSFSLESNNFKVPYCFNSSGFSSFRENVISSTLTKSGGSAQGGSETLIVGTLDTQCGYQKATFQSVTAGHVIVQDNPCPPHYPKTTYCINGQTINKSERNGGRGLGILQDYSYTLTTTNPHAIYASQNIGKPRRLMPIECERLQGFPDNYTQIPYRNKSKDLAPDGPRYAALGNSMAVPVMNWIGKRISMQIGVIPE
ncbi:hypothetical protein F888_03611 [Acinetobacter courvalinii]|uniref:Cytosine-specific methyltransferase n=1 Tax=Acinetobacter courvalinii TaxID=280147 RepID=N9PQN8_9GAMM|nr:DNA cytosine methyltransferase [Acinetobacter courvalinii]ENX35778.1 hypothetical protein F888_03611 [Acinetobacter courvalinii]KAB0655929.1 DNA cytosine methyltransferase [Acinetobacter courvalinii]GGH39230.1 cytosine-specific methyltransferase [Acinetobacter courvalinii]